MPGDDVAQLLGLVDLLQVSHQALQPSVVRVLHIETAVAAAHTVVEGQPHHGGLGWTNNTPRLPDHLAHLASDGIFQ